jgi:four helix bundle protein
MITQLEDFRAYNLAMELGEDVWKTVQNWDKFSRWAIGLQFVEAADSIAANLSEGLGRYHYREAKNFSYYSRGSLFETKTWLTKAHLRKLIGDDFFNQTLHKLDRLGRMINSYINSIGKEVSEDSDHVII